MQHMPSFAGQFLKNYRTAHKQTQEQLAVALNIEPRTLRAYENGERQLNNVNELRRIAEALGVEPELLGVAASPSVPKSPVQIEETVERVWALMDEIRVYEASVMIARLLQNMHTQTITDDPQMLGSFAHALHVAGYVASMSARTSEVPLAISHYHEMESVARLMNDPTLLTIALTYQGDMYRRLGEIKKAVVYLEAARDTTPGANAAARGNGLQMLGRASLLKRDIRNFERAMAEAEEIAATIDPATNSIHGHYNLGTVYEEYVKSYATFGQTEKALDYLKLTEEALPQTPNNRILLMIARAEALIYGGELHTGEPLAIEAARVSREQGHYRRLERIQNIKRYLHQQALKYGNAETELDEALNGPIERWNLPVS